SSVTHGLNDPAFARSSGDSTPDYLNGRKEATTRALLIDPQLRGAGWPLDDHSRVGFEIPVDGYDAEPWNGSTHYCLWDAAGNVLGVVEAKMCRWWEGS